MAETAKDPLSSVAGTWVIPAEILAADHYGFPIVLGILTIQQQSPELQISVVSVDRTYSWQVSNVTVSPLVPPSENPMKPTDDTADSDEPIEVPTDPIQIPVTPSEDPDAGVAIPTDMPEPQIVPDEPAPPPERAPIPA